MNETHSLVCIHKTINTLKNSIISDGPRVNSLRTPTAYLNSQPICLCLMHTIKAYGGK